MSDGADQGIRPDRALRTILGGEPEPQQEEGMSPSQMLEWIETAPTEPNSYDDATRMLAKGILLFARAHLTPDRLKSLAADDFDDAWKTTDEAGRRATFDACHGPTGFMFGWAYNAVRYCSELPPKANPAILEVSVADPEPAA